MIWHLLHYVKSMVKISSIFVAFLENMNIIAYYEVSIKQLCIPEPPHFFLIEVPSGRNV